MARVIYEAIEIHPGTLFDNDGAARRWIIRVTAEVKSAAIANAPPTRSRAKWRRPSTGRLRRSISGKTARSGYLQAYGTVGVGNVPYANYVLGGTAYQGYRYIYSTRGWAHKAEVDMIASRVGRGGKAGEDTAGLYMRLPLTGVGGGRIFHLRVHGQRANNFLFDGYNEVAHIHTALHPFHNPYAF